jgi:hypothetical protein
MCGNKKKHENQYHAVQAMIRLKEKGCFNINTYKCEYCGYWHVGHFMAETRPKPRHNR